MPNVGILILITACTSSLEDISPCPGAQTHPLSWTSDRDLQFSPEDVIDTFPSDFELSLAWKSSETTRIPSDWLDRVHVKLEPNLALDPELLHGTPTEVPSTEFDVCATRLVVPVQLSLISDDLQVTAVDDTTGRAGAPFHASTLEAIDLAPGGVRLRATWRGGELSVQRWSTTAELPDGLQIDLDGDVQVMTLRVTAEDVPSPLGVAFGAPEATP